MSKAASKKFEPASGLLDHQMLDGVVRKVGWRIVPLLFLGSVLAALDKSNVGVASLQMNGDIGLSPATYGFGVSLFLVVYAVCEVPSNLGLARFGARVWLTRIMVTWGIVSLGGALITGSKTFLLSRVLLGMAEAGFLPGAIAFLSVWLPNGYRARVMSYFMISVPIAGVIGGPLSAGLLLLDGWGGLRGWQWLFIVEGLPPIILALVMWRSLRDRPLDASWLAEREKAVLTEALDRDTPPQPATSPLRDVIRAIVQPTVLLFIAVLGCLGGVMLAVTFWLPQILKGAGLSSTQAGIASALPPAIGVVAMILWSRHSDRTGEKCWHVAVPAMIAGTALALAALAPGFPLRFMLLAVAIASVLSMQGVFWAAVSQTLIGDQRVVGIAAINAGGTLIALLAPYLIGVSKQLTGGFDAAFVLLGLFGIVGGLLSFVLSSFIPPREVMS